MEKCTDGGAEFPRYTSKHPVLVKVRPEFLRNVGSFRHIVRFSNKNQTVVTKAGSFLDAPRLPYRIISSEQFAKMLQELKLLRQTPFFQTHAHEGEE